MSLFLLGLAKWIIILILLIYLPRRNSVNLLLAGGLLMMSLFDLTHYLAITGASNYLTAIFYFYTSPWVTLIGPLFYIYIRNILADRNKFYWLDLLHTLPFWLMWINHYPYYALPFEQKLAFAERLHIDLNTVRDASNYLLIGHFPLNMLRGLQNLVYFLACGWRLYTYFRRIPEHPEVPLKQTKITLKWLSFLVASLTIVSFFYVLLVLDMRNEHLSAASFQTSNAYILLLVFYGPLSLSLLFFPEILYGLPRARTILSFKPQPANLSPVKPISFPGKTTLPDFIGDGPSKQHPAFEDPFHDLSNKILEYIHTERPYLQPGFSVTDLSIQFEVPRHHIDYCFSRVMLEKFTDMRKRLRVEHAKSLLTAHHNLSMEGIGKESGFASKSSFFSSFREVMGMTPAEFIRSTSESADMLPG